MRIVCRFFTTIAFLLIFLSIIPAFSQEAYKFELMWPQLEQYFDRPSGIAADSSGNVYVVDSGNSRIQRFDSDGKLIIKWGSYGTGDGQFRLEQPGVGGVIFLRSVVVDLSGNVYLADTGNHRIQKFDSNGNFLTKWGALGTEDGQFDSPEGIAADLSGNVYVTDSRNHRIQKFDSNGRFITKWGSEGTDDGEFLSPKGVAVDSLGYVYVTDLGWPSRIQKFDSSGNLITKWSYGYGEEQFFTPTGVAIGSQGVVYVTDDFFVKMFDSSGNFITKWRLGLDGEYTSANGIAVDPSGSVYVADIVNDRIQKFDSNGKFIAQWLSYGMEDGQFNSPEGVAVDFSGYVYVADAANHRIQKFDSSGNFITKWGAEGIDEGQFKNPRDVAVDPSGYVYVADWWNFSRFQKFDSNGNFIYMRGCIGSSYPLDIGVAVDSSGNVYVVCRNLGFDEIQKFDSNGNFIIKWGSEGKRNGEFDRVSGIAVDQLGHVYVVDWGNNRIQKFDSDGKFITKWGAYGGRIATDSSGNVYASSFPFIQKFNSTGNLITQWGSEGTDEGQFKYSGALAIDSSGNVYVADRGNNRIQKFSFTPLINLHTPSDKAEYDACSLDPSPVFSWNARGTFTNYEIQFSPDSHFPSVSVKVKVVAPAIEAAVSRSIWKKAMVIPGTSGGIVYWRVIGTKTNNAKVPSGVRSIIIEPSHPVGSPTISPTSKGSNPELSWQNNCNIKYKVSFGSDSSFTKKIAYAFNIKNPNDNEGKFIKSSTSSQWRAIRKLVGDKSGSTIYWYVESWDGLNRYNKTQVMKFVLQD